jgi:hypothetical protein
MKVNEDLKVIKDKVKMFFNIPREHKLLIYKGEVLVTQRIILSMPLAIQLPITSSEYLTIIKDNKKRKLFKK